MKSLPLESKIDEAIISVHSLERPRETPFRESFDFSNCVNLQKVNSVLQNRNFAKIIKNLHESEFPRVSLARMGGSILHSILK
jgi:hypothetical protein